MPPVKTPEAAPAEPETDRPKSEKPQHPPKPAPPADAEQEEKGFHLSKQAISFLIVVLLLLLIGGLLYWSHARQFVSTDDAYTTGHVHPISSRIAGTVEEVRVQDNQHVHIDELLLRLDPRDSEVAVQQAEAALRQARAQAGQARARITQAQAQSSSAQAQIAQAHAQVAQVQAQLDRARADYERIFSLFAKDARAVSQADVDQATEAFHQAMSQLEGARASLAASEAQAQAAAAQVRSAQADAEAAKATIATHEAQVRQARLQLSYCKIVAPVDGQVSRKTVERGQQLAPGQALLAIVPDDIWVLANLKETQLERLQIGQRVDLELDSLPGATFFGKVQSLQEGSGATFSLLPPDNATGNFTKIVQRVPVKIVFDPESIRDFRDKIVPGLSVTPRIDLESLHDQKREEKRRQTMQKQNREAEKRR